MPLGKLPLVGTGNSAIDPAVVILPILLPPVSVNQRSPSGPAVIPFGWLPAVGIANSMIDPLVVILPILFVRLSVNQRFPSGPAVMPIGSRCVVGSGNSATTVGTADKRNRATVSDRR